jgi:hypothetical protein
LDVVCERYRRAVADDSPILQPTMSESGRLLERDVAWRTAVADGTLNAFTHGSEVRIENGANVELPVPLTGTTAGESYAGTRSGWLTVPPGTSVVAGGDGVTVTRRR